MRKGHIPDVHGMGNDHRAQVLVGRADHRLVYHEEGRAVHVTRFGWTSNATEWGPIFPSVQSMAEAFHHVNVAVGEGAFGQVPFTAWEYDDQLWKFATDFLAAAKVGTYVERYYGLFEKSGFSFDDVVRG